MSETMSLPPVSETETKRTPTVYFIDDSATMREVIKIAFRRENINVITCADAASALAQFEQTRPDIVITDVIMPDQDGYSVCSQIKQHADLGNVPVVLMSGVVNKSVADKAVAVPAWNRALADAFAPKPSAPAEPAGPGVLQTVPPARPAASNADIQKLRVEIARLDLLVKKLQTELQIERQYNQALEAQIRTLTESA